MRRSFQVKLGVLGCLAVIASSTILASAAAAAHNPVIQDCNSHATLTGSYSIQQLGQALNILTATEKAYTDCPDVIQRALATAVAQRRTRGGVGSSSSSSFLPTPVIIILVILILGAISFAAIAVRRRRSDGDR